MRERSQLPPEGEDAPCRRWGRRTGAALAVAGAIVAVWLVGGHGDRGPAEPADSLAELVDELARGRPGALARAKATARAKWDESLPALAGMLIHDEAPVRAAACEILADRGQADLVASLVPRVSDADWRVRSAAWAALTTQQPQGDSTLLRDVPLNQRERRLLAWVDAWDARAPKPLGAELCELYAPADHIEVGRPLVARCLSCHAGRTPQPPDSARRCADCHAGIVAEWSSSAHGNSLSHLRLTTVDPDSRQPGPMTFGRLRGITCGECHTLRQPPSAGPASRPAGGKGECPMVTPSADSPAHVCRRCHESTWRQWQAWRGGTQPRRVTWPPGDIDLSYRGDTRTCVDCHMPPSPGTPDGGARSGLRRHAWSARRDVALLRDGLHAQLLRASDDNGRPTLRLVLTNLAGHAFPTGSHRRALEVQWRPGTQAFETVALLAPRRIRRLGMDTQDALPPGRQQSFLLPVGADAQRIEWRLVYRRNHFDSDAYRVELLAGSGSLGG